MGKSVSSLGLATFGYHYSAPMPIRGTLNTVDTVYISILNGRSTYNSGTLQLFDTTYQAPMTGIVIGGHCYMSGDQTFAMGQLVGDIEPQPRYGVYGTGSTPPASNDPSIMLYDSTYWNVVIGPDGTYTGEYSVRAYDPQWINYSIWYIAPPDRSDSTMVGYRYRDPERNDVGNYYASMEMPEQPGHYEIRWLEQKLVDTAAWEIRQRFTVDSNGLVPFPDYS